jgi:hypothetical protein
MTHPKRRLIDEFEEKTQQARAAGNSRKQSNTRFNNRLPN